MKADSQASLKVANQRHETHISWSPAPEGWITINTDGSVLHQTKQAAAGGILRDWLGRKLATFACNLGTCTIMRAELRAAEIGFRIAWDLGFCKVHLQLDSQAAAATITGASENDSRHGLTIQKIADLRKLNWETSISHIFREGNKVADQLAHHGHSLDLGVHLNCLYPSSVDKLIWDDFCGASTPRFTLINQ
ncbi:Putative ribonuclease H protein At1g65750 [Linum perenne]